MPVRVWLWFLLLAASPVRGGGDLAHIEWIVGVDGRIWVWPNDDYAVELREPAPWMGQGFVGPDADLLECIRDGGAGAGLMLLLPGTLDVASVSDAEHHFEKLALGTCDQSIIQRLQAAPREVARGPWRPARRRAQLDRLLATRIAGKRRLEAALPALRELASAEETEHFLRVAAQEAAAEITGKVPPVIEVATRDPQSALKWMPSDADIVVLVDQRRVPRWTRVWRIAKAVRLVDARLTLRHMGAAVREADLARWQNRANISLELGYELARQVGNHKRFWELWALRLQPRVAVRLHMQGKFDRDELRLAVCRTLGKWIVERDDDELRASCPTHASSLSITGERVRFARGSWADGSLEQELLEEGIATGHAVWAHAFRPQTLAHFAPVLRNAQWARVTVSFETGVRVAFHARYTDRDAARAAKAQLDSLCIQAEKLAEGSGDVQLLVRAAELARMIEVSCDNTLVQASFETEKGAEQLLDWLVCEE